MLLDAAFEVAGLVGMDDIPLGELVEHGAYFRQECFGSGLVVLRSAFTALRVVL